MDKHSEAMANMIFSMVNRSLECRHFVRPLPAIELLSGLGTAITPRRHFMYPLIKLSYYRRKDYITEDASRLGKKDRGLKASNQGACSHFTHGIFGIQYPV